MWITKTIFEGRNKNKTIEISESTTKEFAEKMYSRQVQRWFNIIVGDIDEIPGGFQRLWRDIDSEHNDKFMLELINKVLELSNKYEHNETPTSFSIEVCDTLTGVANVL